MTLSSVKILCTALFLTCVPARALTPADAPSGTYVIDKTHASVTWKVKHMNLALYSARFTKFDASINYDSANPTKSSVTATIDPNSVRTDYPYPEKEDFDKKVATDAKLLNSSAFPEIKFVSTKLVAVTKTKGRLTGNLTLLGVTKPVELMVELTGALKEHPYAKVPALGFAATGTFKRSDFGMTFGLGPVGDDIQLDINGEFVRPAAK